MASAQGTAFQDAAFFRFSPAADDGLSGKVNHGFKTGDRLRSQGLQRVPSDLAFPGRFAPDQARNAVTARLKRGHQSAAYRAGNPRNENAGGVHESNKCSRS